MVRAKGLQLFYLFLRIVRHDLQGDSDEDVRSNRYKNRSSQAGKSGDERVMGLEPTISCLGSKRSTTELHPRRGGHYNAC